MPPALPVLAPYDTLGTVTALTRIALADWIENFNPNLAGTVTTNGTLVTLTAGSPFSFLLVGQTITIANVQYVVQAVTDFTHLVLTSSAGAAAGQNYTAVIPLGDIFADAQPYVLPTVNLAWRKLQKKLADKGHPRLRNEIDLFALPVITNLDPVSQQSISWTQFFDGTNFLPDNQNPPLLPPDFISPFRLWERPNGMTVDFRRMQMAGDSLWSRIKTDRNKYFDWRGDAIYFPGSLLSMDMRISYSAFLPDLTAIGVPFSQVPVPIMRSADALAFYAAGLYAAPRGGAAIAGTFEAKGDAAVDQITNAFAKLQQRASFHRRAWGERGRRTYGRISSDY